tara:strand:- start:219 stop:404 length:186 start_codon:yes stop_codon:yes gene_type:complete
MCFILFYLYKICFIRKDYNKQQDEINTDSKDNQNNKDVNNDFIYEINYDSDPPPYSSIIKY